MTQDQSAESNADLPDLEEFISGDPMVEEIEALKAERDEFRDRFMRALADAENSRKRADRDRREAEQYGSTRLARDLLPVFDNLTRALNASTFISGTLVKSRPCHHAATVRFARPLSATAMSAWFPNVE